MDHKIKILLAEDDPNLGTVFSEFLEMKDYEVALCKDGMEGIRVFKKEKFDLCILDIMMPKKDGFTLAKEIKSLNDEIPIIFLTAKSMKEDKLEGFRIGADDYITKPFMMEELIARINAVLRRSKKIKAEDSQTEFQLGEFDFNSNQQVLKTKGEEQSLTSKEAELLKMLCLSINNILPKETALNSIWGDDDYFNGRSMDVFITKLRNYLKSDPTLEIINIRGKGYKLVQKS